ncbi:hypothetical protein HK405_003040 [Cladochytrium tenue]|nr:hypothetical protein HK405_003040 [Cladochytrium tenue]
MARVGFNRCPPVTAHFHSSAVARKALLVTGVTMGIIQGARAAVTAIPILYRWNFFKKYPKTMWSLAALPGVAVVAVVISSLDEHPITSRSRLMFVDEATEMELSAQEEMNLVSSFNAKIVPDKHPLHAMVEPVALNLIHVVGREYRNWRLVVVDSPETVNAMVLPAGTIFVFSGLLNQTETLSELAGVLAHEIAHVVSRHGAETVGVDVLLRVVWDIAHSVLYTFSVNLPMIADISGRTLDAAAPLLGSRPYSRMLESEADEIGIYMMAAVCIRNYFLLYLQIV